MFSFVFVYGIVFPPGLSMLNGVVIITGSSADFEGDEDLIGDLEGDLAGDLAGDFEFEFGDLEYGDLNVVGDLEEGDLEYGALAVVGDLAGDFECAVGLG